MAEFEYPKDPKIYSDFDFSSYKAHIIGILEGLPSAEPEQRHGKWIVIMNEPNITFDECKCSECGVIEYFNKGWKKFSFCPNCGARMDMERE